jgi:hypothetical protein
MKPQMQFIDVQIALNNAAQGGWELVQVGYMNFGVAFFKKCT